MKFQEKQDTAKKRDLQDIQKQKKNWNIMRFYKFYVDFAVLFLLMWFITDIYFKSLLNFIPKKRLLC